MVMAAIGLLRDRSAPTEQEVREALDGNLCRCGAHGRIIRSVLKAVGRTSDGPTVGPHPPAGQLPASQPPAQVPAGGTLTGEGPVLAPPSDSPGPFSVGPARARQVLTQAAYRAGWDTRGHRDGIGYGAGVARYSGVAGYCAAVAEVQADTDIRVRRLWLAVDVGRVINPDGVINQVEGGAVQSASWTLREQVRFDRDKITSAGWDSYPVLRFTDTPEVMVRVMDAPGEAEVGAGEVDQGPVAGAIGNAVADAVGVRVRDLPLTRERVAQAIEES
jgi:CO/xanthine dehydrogenase Mo-binding subunit